MKVARTVVVIGAALFLTLLATLGAQGNLLGGALTSALIPSKASSVEVIKKPVATKPLAIGQLYAEGRVSFKKLQPLPPEFVDEETLWLARCIFSESKRPHEQELVAWVIRNRVETEYRGRSTYKDVVLDPMQFSAFNQGSRKRAYYTALEPSARVPGWQTALRIAHDVRWSDAQQWRPFSTKTRHFYSEQSMVGQQHPNWAHGYKPVAPEREYNIAAHRFRFFEGVN